MIGARHVPVGAPNVHRPAAIPATQTAASAIHRTLAPNLHTARQMSSLSESLGVKIAEAAKDAGGALDAVGGAGATTRLARAGGDALKAATRHMSAMGQIGRDVTRMTREVGLAEEAVRSFKSPAAASALVFMKPALAAAEGVYEQEKALWYGYLKLSQEYSVHSETGIGKFALGAEKIVSKSLIGRGLLETGGKILSNRWVDGGLKGVGAGIAAIKGYEDSVLKSRAGKAVSAATSGLLSLGTDVAMSKAALAGKVHPAALLFDPAVKYGAQAIGLGDAGDKITFGKWAEGTANVLSGIAGALWTGDSKPLDDVHARNMSGKNGMVLQGYAMLGEAIASSSIVDSAMMKVADWIAGVPPDFTNSDTWWSGAESGLKN